MQHINADRRNINLENNAPFPRNVHMIERNEPRATPLLLGDWQVLHGHTAHPPKLEETSSADQQVNLI